MYQLRIPTARMHVIHSCSNRVEQPVSGSNSRCQSKNMKIVGWLLGCLTSQQHASVSQGRICSDKFTCCHTEIEVADQSQPQHTDTGLTSPSADPLSPGAWQGSHWSANVLSHWYDSTPEKILAQAGFEPGISRSRGGRLNH